MELLILGLNSHYELEEHLSLKRDTLRNAITRSNVSKVGIVEYTTKIIDEELKKVKEK